MSEVGSLFYSSSKWVNQERPRMQHHFSSLDSQDHHQKSSSYLDLISGKRTLDDIMKEFKMNGSDSPYDPDEDNIWKARPEDMIGLGQTGTYLRQKSWPEPDRSPVQRLPKRTAPEWMPASVPIATSTPINDDELMINEPVAITAEQSRVLSSLPDAALYALLRRLQRQRAPPTAPAAPVAPADRCTDLRLLSAQECRFCKNNGEREAYYRSHALKDGGGRVACPVLRAFVCKRCGASGDAAHTIKYCPLSTNEERLKSAAMMRSVRMASGRRRLNSLTPSVVSSEHYAAYGEAAPSVIQENNIYSAYDFKPLDPLWAALEQKLML